MNEYSWNLDSGQYLQHFGILGMKWGVRRYQNADGSYTNAGKDRYFGGHDYKKQNGNVKTKKSSDAYLKDVAKAKSKGMSEEDAEAYAKRKQNIRKAIAISAGIAVASIATYAGVKYYKNNIQDVIAGTAKMPLKRVQTFDGIHNMPGAIYVANAKDNARYVDVWGRGQRDILAQRRAFAFMNPGENYANQDVYNMDLVYNGGKGVKIASTPHAKKIFNQMIKNDPEFKSQVEDMIKKGGHRFGENLYDNFNINMAEEGRKSDAAKKFYKVMKEHGYSGIKDVNDAKYSGFNTKSASIIFDGTYDWKAHKLTDEDFANAAKANEKLAKEIAAEANREVLAENISKKAGIYGTIGAGVFAANRTKYARATSMRNAGVPVSEIAKQLGISESEVYKLTSDSKK